MANKRNWFVHQHAIMFANMTVPPAVRGSVVTARPLPPPSTTTTSSAGAR